MKKKHKNSKELEIRPEYVERIRRIEKQKHICFKTIEDLRKYCEGKN